MSMTPEEIDARRLELLEAAALREIEGHNALMAARQAEENERAERVRLRTREVVAFELQAQNNAKIAEASAGTGRTAMILDAAIRRIDDRTSPTGTPAYAKAVAEVLATMAEIERQTALPDDAPADPPTPGLA